MREVALYLDITSLKLKHNFIDSVTRRSQRGFEVEGGLKKFSKNSAKVKFQWKYNYVKNDKH